MRALVLGYGRSGKAAEALLRAQGVETVVLADDAQDRIGGARDTIGEGRFDFAVVSPGIALTHPWIVEAKRRGIPLKSELQLGCEELRRRGWKLLAVTGSKGKSSVVKVVADAINLSGRYAVACGNYGKPVCEVAGRRDQGSGIGDQKWAVVEVSSFMMETTELPPDTFEAAAILNLQEDHLDRHGSLEVYHGLKRKLLTFAAKNFVNEVMSSEHHIPRAQRVAEGDALAGVSIGASEHLWKGSYFDNEILAGNAMIAVELMRVAGLDEGVIARAFREFRPLPHRMNLVAEIGGVRYIDDSKATSIAALVAGIAMAMPIVRDGAGGRETGDGRREMRIRLIAGGLPKGDDPKVALPILTERVKKVYLIGQSAEVFSAAWHDAVDCEICGTMDKAVASAMRDAEKGETVLLSPGTASFDQFQSFGERGDVFADLVKRERQCK